MDRLQQSTRLIEMVADELMTGIGVTWRLSDSAAAVLRAEIVAVLTARLISAELLVKPVED